MLKFPKEVPCSNKQDVGFFKFWAPKRPKLGPRAPKSNVTNKNATFGAF